jgi:hypothetical protein
MIGVTSLLLPWAAHATEPKPPPPDEDFLEFLGSADDEDPELAKYLAKTSEPRSPDSKAPPKRTDGRT